jgi:hypothetical protein
VTTELARTFIDDLDQLPDEIPGAANLEPGRISWLHGTNAAGAKTTGVFYARDTAFTDPPSAPWKQDDRYENEAGYSAAELRIAVIGERSQWFVPGESQGDPSTWLQNYQDGAKKLTEYLITVDGLADPMVLSVSGKYKAGPIAKLISDYRRGTLAQAMRKVKRTLPLWSFWLPISSQRDSNDRILYIKAQDGDGKEYGSIVTPPALASAPVARTVVEILAGADLWQQYQEWLKFKRLPRGTTEAEYTVSSVPALPAPRNVPQPIEEGEIPPF